ncbi:MAG: hypothetical protein E7256_04165 [Lachnospiraceae bacterium]|nr:hypothetical protein [Lachnospiraceae bacterium]
MEEIVRLKQVVTGFTITQQHIDCMCGKDLIKIEKCSGDVIYTKEVFEKEGFSRNLIADGGKIFIYDFCMLYIFSQNNYELLRKWQLGTDLSSDICGMMVDKHTIYCSMRNGKIITIDRKSYEIKEFKVADCSMWSIKAYGDYLVCGTVDGEVLILNKTALSVKKKIKLGTQNIRSLYIDHEILYAASQDKKLFKINLVNLEVDQIKKNVHKRMYECVGLYDDMLVTVSYPGSEIVLWDKETLEKKKEFQVPLKLDGRTYIDNDYLYLSSRNILGINRICLKE